MSDTPNSPAWRPDPTGRFAQRWFDGSRWTEHVADAQGSTSTDPYDAPAAAPEPPPAATPGAPGARWSDPTTVDQPAAGSQGDVTSVYAPSPSPAPAPAEAPPTAQQPPAGAPAAEPPPGQPGWGTANAPAWGAPQAASPQPAASQWGAPPPAAGVPPGQPAWGQPATYPPAQAYPAAAERRGLPFSIVGLILWVIGAAAVIVGLFALSWINAKGLDSTKILTGNFHTAVAKNRPYHDITFVTRAFPSWGGYVALIVGLIVTAIAIFLRRTAVGIAVSVIAAILAVVCGVWAGFVGFDLAHWLKKDHLVNNASAGVGMYVTAIGFFVLAVAALLPAPRRRI